MTAGQDYQIRKSGEYQHLFPPVREWEPRSVELYERTLKALRKWGEDESTAQARESMSEGSVGGHMYFTEAGGWEAGWFMSEDAVRIIGITDPKGVAQGPYDIEPLKACYDLMPRELWDAINKEAERILCGTVAEAG
jgi:hypothetical protein